MIKRNELRLDAERLEALMPLAMRVLYSQELHDPLMEFSVPQLRMVRALSSGPRTASALGEEMGLSVSAITQMANRLEHVGLVARSDDSDDRRLKHLSLTETGRDALAQRRARRVSQAQQALANLSPEVRRQLIDALDSLVASGGKLDSSQPPYLIAELEQRLPPLPNQTI